MQGFINLYKPKDMSSAQAVAIVRKTLHRNCGHMGTLDPLASGILPIGIEKTTRLFQYLLNKTKTYVAEFQFGYLTDSLDITGKTVDKTDVIPTREQIEKVLPEFSGEIEQIPPKFSAKCVNGKRGYELARRGIDFELAPKKVRIDSIKIVDGKDGKYIFEIVCGGGTYIRSLARDIASKCNSLAVMTALERKTCGNFTTDNCVSVEELKSAENPEKFLLPPDIAVDFPKLVLTDEQATKILNGVFPDYGFTDGIYRVYNGESFWGIGQAKDGVLRINAYVR